MAYMNKGHSINISKRPFFIPQCSAMQIKRLFVLLDKHSNTMMFKADLWFGLVVDICCKKQDLNLSSSQTCSYGASTQQRQASHQSWCLTDT